MYDIITMGSATVDVFAKTKSELITIETGTEKEQLIAYPSGHKILITDLQFMVGGGGTNTAVAFSRLGLNTGYIGRLGKDTNANLILDLLEKEKINFLGSQDSKSKTGYSIILDSIERDRTILTFKGANNTLTDFDTKKIKTKWCYFSSMVGDSFETQKKIAKYAYKNKIKIVYNPSNYQAEKGPEFLKELLTRATILILNLQEAQYLVGKRNDDNLLRALHSLGPKVVVVTNGNKGSIASDGTTHYMITPHQLEITETTGAGDAFASGFVAGYIMNSDMTTSLQMGLANAESVVTNYGAKNILLTKSQIERRIKDEPGSVETRKLEE